MPSLKHQELEDFLAGGPHILRLATSSYDGWPVVNPVWYNYDGHVFTVAGRRQAKWVENIRHNSKVGMCIDTSEVPYVRVLIRGSAEVVEEHWMPDVPDRAQRYLGEKDGEAYFESKKHIARALIRITPIEIISWTGDWHTRYMEA